MSTPGVPGGALPFSGPLDLAAINTEFGLGTDLTNYHGVRWYYDGNLTTGLFGGSTIKISDFRGKRATDPAGAGIYFSNTSGSGSTVTPLYRNTITIEIWGAGGGGGGANGSNGAKGGDTSIVNYQPPSGGTFPSDYTAGGGKGGDNGNVPVPPPPLDTSARNGGRDPVTSVALGVLNGQIGITTYTDGKMTGFFDGSTYRDVQTGKDIGLGGPEGLG